VLFIRTGPEQSEFGRLKIYVLNCPSILIIADAAAEEKDMNENADC
jgi:hypothetical protein